MKYICIVFLFVAIQSFGQDSVNELTWYTNLEKAQKVAKKKKKPVLVYFTGSDWCSPCKMLKEDFFENEKFLMVSDKFVLVEIDSPFRVDIISEKQMKYNKEVISKYNEEGTFPKLIVLNKKGKVLGKISGYSMLRDATSYFKFIEKEISDFY